MPFATKKPVTIEYRVFDPSSDYDDALDVCKWAGGVPNDDGFLVPTLEGTHQVRQGWVVIKGVKGEFYGCEPEVFDLSYDKH